MRLPLPSPAPKYNSKRGVVFLSRCNGTIPVRQNTNANCKCLITYSARKHDNAKYLPAGASPPAVRGGKATKGAIVDCDCPSHHLLQNTTPNAGVVFLSGCNGTIPVRQNTNTNCKYLVTYSARKHRAATTICTTTRYPPSPRLNLLSDFSKVFP